MALIQGFVSCGRTTTHYRGRNGKPLCGGGVVFAGNGKPTCGACKRISRTTDYCDMCDDRTPIASMRRLGDDEFGARYRCQTCDAL